jgi:starch phosphorylase
MGNPIYTAVPAEQIADPITELALDLRWTWNHSTDDLWRELEPELWEATRNPWLILQSVSRRRLEQLLGEHRFCDRVEELLGRTRMIEASDAWFQRAHPGSGLKLVAYFSMEYMLSEALPIYSGGLGNVAGDHLKSASDLGVPVIGLGLLYQQGYFRQEIDLSGRQIAEYPFNEPGQLPVRPLRTQEGDWLRLRLSLPGHQLWIRAWEARIGRTKLYLLDTNDPANAPAHRTISGELYGGGSEVRLRQEMVLGIGGWRLLRALGLRPDVCHLNEGHTAFAAIDRVHSFMQDHNQPFDVALTATRAGTLFTTHTAVQAGFDRFAPELMRKYFERYAEDWLKIPLSGLLALGRLDPANASEPFNMAYLAIRASGTVNGVSRLHGGVSRRLFQVLFPRWPEAEVPVSHVTNGIHVPTWDSAEADALWAEACGEERWRGSLEFVPEQIRCLSDDKIWQFRNQVRKTLVEVTRKRLAKQREFQGWPPEEVEKAGRVFDESRLTLGFARRFAEYKRPDMLLHDPRRLIGILTAARRPVQLILAGKAHPQDEAGQAIIRRWHEFIRLPEVQGHVVFLADYDMLMTNDLVSGVDLWLNTPRRPWEACGTSGMKVLANGGLNLSELDGWWAEAWAPEVGWAIGDGREHANDPAWDAAEAQQLYSLLENEIVPDFYQRENGIPRQWVARIRESMARLTTVFSANRMTREYTDELYVSLAAAHCLRTQEHGRFAADLVAWQRTLASQWSDVRFGAVQIVATGSDYSFLGEVHLGAVRPDNVQVEIYADRADGEQPFRMPMSIDYAFPDSPGSYVYSAAVPANCPADHYTPRIIPRREGVRIPLETGLIVWQK